MSCEFFLDEPSNDNCGCGNNFQSPFMFSIDIKKEMYKAVKEERYEDAAMLRDGQIPDSVLRQNTKMYFKPISISTDDFNSLFE